jgi:hypothetical protein
LLRTAPDDHRTVAGALKAGRWKPALPLMAHLGSGVLHCSKQTFGRASALMIAR